MIQVRRGVFETNSSSTHSISMCMKSEYDAWKNGKVYLNEDRSCGKQFLTRNEAMEAINQFNQRCDVEIINWEALDNDDIDDILYQNEIYTFDNYFRCEEDFMCDMKTPNGEEVVAFGYYGWD